jgi:plastocyanin
MSSVFFTNDAYAQYMGNVGSKNETGQYTLEEALEIQKRRIESAKIVSIIIPNGTSSPRCEIHNACYSPASVTINAGDTVKWTNTDTTAHTVTSGNPADGSSGVFDSSLIMSGALFEHTFDEAGSYDYFCVVHPWMLGNVQVSKTSEINFNSTIKESQELQIPAPFVDTQKDPRYYVDRYYNESKYKEWFDANYPEYSSIYEAVGMTEEDYLNSTANKSDSEPLDKVKSYEPLEPSFSNFDSFPEQVESRCDLVYLFIKISETSKQNKGFLYADEKGLDDVSVLRKEFNQALKEKPWKEDEIKAEYEQKILTKIIDSVMEKYSILPTGIENSGSFSAKSNRDPALITGNS